MEAGDEKVNSFDDSFLRDIRVCGWRLYQPRGQRYRGVACQAHAKGGRLGRGHYQLSTFNYQLPTSNIKHQTSNIKLSTFNFSEQRRIAADFGQPRVPVAVKRAITGAEKAMARSRKRAEKGLCTKEESDDFCAKSAAALKSYLDKQVKEGTITPAERKALGR